MESSNSEWIEIGTGLRIAGIDPSVTRLLSLSNHEIGVFSRTASLAKSPTPPAPVHYQTSETRMLDIPERPKLPAICHCHLPADWFLSNEITRHGSPQHTVAFPPVSSILIRPIWRSIPELRCYREPRTHRFHL